MASKYTKRYSEEFKRDAVALVAPSGRTVTEAARELGISSESLRGWVKKAYGTGQTGAGTSVAAGSGPDTAEREELKRLRKLAADQAGQDNRGPDDEWTEGRRYTGLDLPAKARRHPIESENDDTVLPTELSA